MKLKVHSFIIDKLLFFWYSCTQVEVIIMAGIVFNIQKFSLHDGPGIRTVVFLKGCPLACKWCANPESQHKGIQVLVDHSKCIQCMKCINICKNNAISIVDNKIHINHTLCTNCMACVHACKEKALQMEGKLQDVEDVIEVIMQDKDFYEESQGGVTISGGEVLNQADFAIEIINDCKKNNISVAIETTGYADFNTFKQVIEDVDLLLFDMKHHDTNKHYEGTRVYNETIIKNLKYATSIGKQIIARIPVIPNYNNSLDDAYKFSILLKEIGIKKVNILPFHQFGLKKYEMMNIPYEMKDVKQLHPEDLIEFQQVMLDQQLDCYF